MKRTRFLSLILALVLAFVLAVPAGAVDLTYEVEGGKLTFDASTGTITKCDASVTNAVIPSAINGVPVTAIGDFAFFWTGGASKLQSVTIPNTVTTIGRNAFQGCGRLTSVVIPDSVTKLGQDIFANCVSLSQVTLGTGMTQIARTMFQGCTALRSIDIPSNITSIGYDAFNHSGITDITIPDSVTTISGCAFSGCDSLTSITIPNSVTQLGDCVFEYCTNLTDVRLSNSLTILPRGTFQNCSNLETVVIPSGVVTVDSSVFRFCRNLKAVTIPASVTKIAGGAFYGCDSLTDVYYGSDAAHWSLVDAGGLNDSLVAANIHFSGPVAGFTDVTTGDYYADAVDWAVQHGVTGGTSATTFSPAAAVTRAQAMTFLWRAAGSPEPVSSASPFTDVADPSAYYYKPVLWAAEQGITGGVSATEFGVNIPLAYDQIFTFLCKAAGETLPGSDWSAGAVAWAKQNGLTDQLSFSAKTTCPRSDVIYCLWKQLA